MTMIKDQEATNKEATQTAPPPATTKTTVLTVKIRVVALVATIPARKLSCERLLGELSRQSRRPDGVVLVLDGYNETAPPPACPLPVLATHRSAQPVGAGSRWRAARDLLPEDIVICVDDDIMLVDAPKFVASLVAAVETGGGAAAAMGRTFDGRFAPPGAVSRGDLVHGLGCGLAMRAKHLAGLQELAASVRKAGGPDALGLRGDDDALVSTHLWKSKVRILHATTGNIYAAPGTQASAIRGAKAQAKMHPSLREHPDAQKQMIKKITGWPWFIDNGMRRPSRGAAK